MCKIVYLTSKCFDKASRQFRNALANELRSRKIDVIEKSTCILKQFFMKHHTYGIAIAIDFFNDNKDGCGLTLNKRCSFISRDFAYNLSDALDLLTPSIRWRDFKFVDSDDKEWYKFFNKVSAFADEIIRCLRSNYDYVKYQQSAKLAKLRARKRGRNGMDE